MNLGLLCRSFVCCTLSLGDQAGVFGCSSRASAWFSCGCTAGGYSNSGLFGSSVLWALLSTWCGAEVCMLAFGVRMWLPPKGGGPPKTRKKHSNTNNECEKTSCISHTYKVGDEVLCLKRGIKSKYSKHKSDTYRITKVHSNGTVTMKQGVKRQCISIRNIEPYNKNKTFRLMRYGNLTYLEEACFRCL